MWFKICGFSISRFCCKSHPSTKTTLELPCRCVEVRIKSQVTLPIYVYATYGAGQHDCAAPRFPNTKTLGRFWFFFSPEPFSCLPRVPQNVGGLNQRSPKAKSTSEIQRQKPKGKSKVARPHLPGSRLGLVGAASGWARSCPRGGRTPSPLASPSAGNKSKETAKACMPAWARMADQRLMSEVTVACCNGAGADRALCCASRRRNSADS